MPEVRLGKVELWECWEQGYIGRGRVVHGLFTDEREAVACFQVVAQRQPWLVVQGALGVERRTVEVLEAVAGAGVPVDTPAPGTPGDSGARR